MASDSELSAIFEGALTVFRNRGYFDATLEEIARAAHVELRSLTAQFPDKAVLLAALLKTLNPTADFDAALEAVPDGLAEDMIRDVMRRMIELAQKHETYFELVVIDSQVNNGSALMALSARLLPKANAILARMKATDDLRPISDLIVARTLIALLMGYVVSERAMPQVARVAMRLFPQRAWIDGMVDILLYGLLEDDSR